MKHVATVIHVSDMEKHPDAVYIGRAMPRQQLKASIWANPYKIGPDMSRGDAIRSYSNDLLLYEKRHLLKELPALRGKPLACWCRKAGERHIIGTNDCHGDVLAGFLNAYSDARLIELAESEAKV